MCVWPGDGVQLRIGDGAQGSLSRCPGGLSGDSVRKRACTLLVDNVETTLRYISGVYAGFVHVSLFETVCSTVQETGRDMMNETVQDTYPSSQLETEK